MSDKPTQTIEWATAGSVVEPSAGKKATGFVAAEKPPAQHENWLKRQIDRWLIWWDEGKLQRSTLTDNTPVLQTCDRNARARHYLGPEGYWMGPAIQEEYRMGPVDLANNVTIGASTDVKVSSGGGLTTIVDVNNQLRIMPGASGAVVTADPQLRMRAVSASASDRAMVLNEYAAGAPNLNQPISDLNNTVVVMEWRAYVSDVADVGLRYMSGLHDFFTHTSGNLLTNTNSFAMFDFDKATDGNWRCRVANGASSDNQDSGVAVAANTLYTFRIELHGSATPVGVDAASAVARFFIDGVEVQELASAHVPSGTAPVGVIHCVDSNVTGPTASRDYNICTTKLAWNAVLDPDVPA